MVRRNLMLALVGSAIAVGGVGCGGGGDGGGDGGTGGPAQTYTYVVRTLTIDTNDAPENPHTGFNLDGHISDPIDPAGCNHQDFFSAIDPDQNAEGAACTSTRVMNGEFCGGVDNQLPTLAGSIAGVMPDLDLNATVAEQINSGKLSLIVQVSDVNSLTSDDSVTVRIALGYPTFSDCNQLFNNGTYQLSTQLLRDGGTTINDAQFSFPGRIVDGRLQVSTDASASFLLPLPSVMGVSLALNLHAPAFRVSLGASGDAQNGNLGGWVAGQELVTAVTAIAPDYEMAARQIIAGLVDIQQDGVCVDGTGDATRYGGISLGLGLSVVPAQLSTDPAVADRASGTCGADAADAGM